MRAAFGVAHLLGGVDLHLEVAALEQLDLELHRFAAGSTGPLLRFVRAKGYAAVYQARLPTRQRAFCAFDSWRTASTSSEAVLRLLLPIAVR